MNQLIATYIAPLHATGCRYMVTGSVASMFYGEPRLTSDIDSVLTRRAEDGRRLRQVFGEGVSVHFAPPEYSIIMKLEFYREGGSEKHLRDIAGMIANRVPIRDVEVRPYLVARGLEDLWHQYVFSKLQS
jgi:hypothetical protein